jgi:hypothetical protein
VDRRGHGDPHLAAGPAAHAACTTRTTGGRGRSTTSTTSGPSLLVAPVLEQGATSRQVWLPEGEWFDFWTDERLHGPGVVTVDAPLETLPLLVPRGAVLPMGPELLHVDEHPCDPLTVHLYDPEHDGSTEVHVDAATTVQVSWRLVPEGLEVACSPAPGRLEVVLHDAPGAARRTTTDAREGARVVVGPA